MSEFLNASDMYKVAKEAEIKEIERVKEEKERKRQEEEKKKLQDDRDRLMAFAERIRVIDMHFIECKTRITDRALAGHLDTTFYGCLLKQHVEVFLRFGYKVSQKICLYPESVKKPNTKVNMPEFLYQEFLNEWQEYSISWDKDTSHPYSNPDSDPYSYPDLVSVFESVGGEPEKLRKNLFKAGELYQMANVIKEEQAEKERLEKEKERKKNLLEIERIKDAQFEECKQRIMDRASSGYTSVYFHGFLKEKHINELETGGYEVTESSYRGSYSFDADEKTTKVDLSIPMHMDFIILYGTDMCGMLMSHLLKKKQRNWRKNAAGNLKNVGI
jgi:hypothetical protein